MTVEPRVEDPNDQFPIGMRVLAVDDDPTCLRLLDTLLRRCQYHVTTTSQAITALKMLRENKNQFDLVISDVHMPDMDGFKLLELVGLEMDLPVIMLSANDDPKLVMKGITHGACDYLLKPVRIEQLKNIWQHVIRRRRFDPRDQNNSDSRDKRQGPGEGGQGSSEPGNPDHGKLNKKRKDQNEDDDEENDENGHDNEDPSSQKKPRVVWSVELHRKFVAAVNQLGIDRAVPKKILDLMNVEKLTRENVASHLQKYRLYLKRISCVANQQANMVAALGSTDSTYLHSLNGLGNFYNLSGSGQLPNSTFRSFPPSGMLGRLNTPSGMGMHCLSSSEMVQLGHLQNSSNPINSGGKFQPVLLPGNQNGIILQGMPMSLELEQLQHNKGIIRVGELSTTIGDSTVFPASSGFPDTKMTSSRSSSSLLVAANSPLMLQGHSQENQRRGGLRNQNSATLLNAELPSSFPDHGRCNDNWSTAVQPSAIQSSSFPLSDCFKQATLHPSNLRDNISSVTLQSGTNLRDVSCVTSMPPPLPDSRTDLECQAMTISSNSVKIMNYSPKVWDDHKHKLSHHSSLGCSSANSLIPAPGVMGTFDQGLDLKNTISDRNMDFNLMGESNFVNPLPMQQNAVEESASDTALQLKQGCTLGQRKPQSSYASNNVGSLEDLVSAMMKQEQDKTTLMEGDLGYDAYSLGTCL
ncbi:hypothetical protein VitviT2T_004853 [Vitis vinifera]|uniref:Two-component response regulator n=2 Tax=Vitis vinifera TaxID=29760 RepID=A0ABY9BQS4_VITVI|nr:two-component response regulator ARR12 [Vitis vinifera]WJZ85308.1 hypothetical protein VitviT2T_004853 [Vitis vinifera]|eukprot:XP_002282928.1 PREDICTED: two-component response regulator ARR12-like isoform X1 [Vitis vinifera]